MKDDLRSRLFILQRSQLGSLVTRSESIVLEYPTLGGSPQLGPLLPSHCQALSKQEFLYFSKEKNIAGLFPTYLGRYLVT